MGRYFLLLCSGLLLVPSLGWAELPPPTEAAIALRPEEIPEHADALLRRLRLAKASQIAEARIARIEQDATTRGRELDAQVEQASAVLARGTSLGDLEDLRHTLEGDVAPLVQWKDELDAEAARVATTLDEIAQAERVWSATRSQPETIAAGDAVVSRVQEVLTALNENTSRLRAWRARVLDLSDRLITRRAGIDAVVEQLRAATVREGANLLRPDGVAFWRPGLGTEIRNELPQAPAAVRAYARATAEYVEANPAPFVLQAVLAVLLMLGLSVLARRQRLRGEDPASERILERPYSIALLLTLLVTPLIHPLAPQRIRQMMGTIALFPTARIVLHVSTRGNVGVFAALFVLMLLDRIGLALATLPALARVTFLLMLVNGIGIALWVIRRTRGDGSAEWPRRAANLVAWMLGLALLAEIGGWATLASVLGRAVIASLVVALYVYVAVITLEALLAYWWASRLVQRIRLVSNNLQLLGRATHRGLRWLGAALWLYLCLTTMGLRAAVADAVNGLLGMGVSVGALSLSVGGVLAFALTLVAALFAARIVDGVLEAEVYPRARLPRGLPYALSTLARYGIYSLGFLFALAAAGVQLGQVTVLIGGLGIGIGLGLQDLVKDFAAGLTLLLERRVHVGDTIQSADKEVSGSVLTIGMRSTVVRNWDGAEVVVPNATLLTGTVKNWTLSDRLVRLEVPVGVAYGTDPNRVVALLLGVAGSVDHIVAEPPPQALFVGFGDSALNFLLRAWTDEGYDRFAATTSALALAIHRDLTAADIAIPFPQRDLHLASVAPDVRVAFAGRDSEEPPSLPRRG